MGGWKAAYIRTTLLLMGNKLDVTCVLLSYSVLPICTVKIISRFWASKISFPTSSWPDGIAATLNASYDKEIAEFTLCYRFSIESYNGGYVWLFGKLSVNPLLRCISWSELDGKQEKKKKDISLVLQCREETSLVED